MRRLSLCLFCAILSAQNPGEWDDIHFETGKSSVLAEGSAILKRLALLLKSHPEYKATLTGYTADYEGEAAYDQKLSLARAGAARDFLVREGARPQQIVVKAQDESATVTRNNNNNKKKKGGLFGSGRVTIKLDSGTEAPLTTSAPPIRVQASPPPSPPPPPSAGRDLKISLDAWKGGSTKRDFLIGPARETKGYGLYSYLLLPRHPAQTETDLTQRYISTLDAYIALDSIASLRDEAAPPPHSQINITYLPVLRAPAKLAAKDLIQIYNYGSAHDSLLPRLRDAHPAINGRDGPFIVSVAKPLLTVNQAPANHLFFDLSGVPPRVVALYIRAFLTEASKERFWEKDRQVWLIDCYSMIEEGGEVLSETEQAYTKKAFLATVSGWFGK